FAPSRTQSQLLVEWLPAHAYLRHKDVGVVVQELLKPAPSRKLQGMKARNCIGWTENRNARLRVESIGLSSTLSGRNWRITDNITLDVQHIRILLKRFATELTAEGQTNAAGW